MGIAARCRRIRVIAGSGSNTRLAAAGPQSILVRRNPGGVKMTDVLQKNAAMSREAAVSRAHIRCAAGHDAATGAELSGTGDASCVHDVARDKPRGQRNPPRAQTEKACILKTFSP